MAAADPAIVLFATALATAVVGLVVAGTAYRGYRTNGSEPMRFLAIGITLITASPFVVSYGVAPVIELSPPVAMLAILGGNILGLLAILYSLDRA